MANIPLRPLGAQFQGAYISVRQNGSTYSSWMDLWVNFDLAYFTDQMDLVKSLGGNAVAIGGDVEWFSAGGLTLAQYLVNRRAVVEAAAARDMYVLPYGASSWHNWGGNRVSGSAGAWPTVGTSVADGTTVIAADAEVLAPYPNVIGYITVDEPWFGATGESNLGITSQVSTSAMATRMQGIHDAVKAVVPADFGVAIANPAGDSASASVLDPTNPRMALSAPFCDFLAFHLFYLSGSRPAVGNITAMRAAYPDKSIIFPSSGAPLSYGNTEIGLQITGIMACAAQERGVMIWTVRDYVGAGGGSADKYGLFDNTPAARTASTTPFTAGLVANAGPLRSIRPYRGKPRLQALRRWGYH